MPRRYSLGQRAADQAVTRARIVAAALALYRDLGSRASTTSLIAALADVAPGTVRNHFPERSELDSAVADAILEEIQPPDVDIFVGLDSPVERVARLAQELADFSARSETWWQVREADPGLAASWAGHERQFDAHVARLVEAALGPELADPVVAAVVRTAVGSPLFYALRGAGLSPDQAVTVELEILTPWLRERGGGAGRGSRVVRPSGGARARTTRRT